MKDIYKHNNSIFFSFLTRTGGCSMKLNWFNRFGVFPVCFMVAVSFLFSVVSVSSAKTSDFSADQVQISTSGKEIKTGKIYFSGDNIRMEIKAPWANGPIINIIRRDKKQMITLMTGKKKYFVKPLNEKDLQSFGSKISKNVKIEKLGNEKIQGFKCKKTKVTSTVDIMGRKVTTTSTVWKNDSIPFPIRTKDEKGNVNELRNISKDKIDKKLFEIPKGYQKVSNMMDMMKP